MDLDLHNIHISKYFKNVLWPHKVSTMLTQCASPLETHDDNGIVNETSAPVFSEAQTKNLDHVDQAPTVPQQTLVPLAQEPLVEAQNGPLEEQAFGLPDEIKGTEKQN